MDDATAPPPGLYYLGSLYHYQARELRLPQSEQRLSGENKAASTLIVNRLIWMTSHQVLGADYGVEILVPRSRNSLQIGNYGVNMQDSGGADIYVSPLILGWHTPRWDVSAGAGVWLGNARSGSVVSPGLGYQRYMFSAGATYYLDESRTWSSSALFKYQRNEKMSHDWRYGDQLHLDWGVGRRWGLLQAGIVGFSRWQVGRDQGLGSIRDLGQNHAVGLQASYIFWQSKMMLRAAYYKEFGSQPSSAPVTEGNMLRMTLIKAF